MVRRVLIILAVAAAAFLLVMVAGLFLRPGSPWRLDPQYSLELTLFASNVRALGLEDPQRTVDVVQVYAGPANARIGWILEEVFRLERVFETRDQARIREVIEGVQRDALTEACTSAWQPTEFHVLMYDRTLMRVGYFRYRLGVEDTTCARIHPFQVADMFTSTIYFTRSLPAFLTRLRSATPWQSAGVPDPSSL